MNISTILARVSEQEIFEYYLRQRIVSGKCVHSPFHADRSPSLYIWHGRNGWKFKDMADDAHSGDCFDLLCQMYTMDIKQVLDMVAKDMSVNEGPMRVAIPVVEFEPHYCKIDVISRKYNHLELSWWNEILQDRSDLIKNDVYACKKVFINDKELYIRKNELVFAYHFPEISDDSWKIYMPQRTREDGKWWSNIPTSHVENKGCIQGKTGIVQKSRKDRMYLQKLFPSVCNVQNESRSGFTEDFRNYLSIMVDDLYFWWDYDDAGIKNSKIITELYGYKSILNPANRPKDVSEWGRQFGPREVVDFLHYKGLI